MNDFEELKLKADLVQTEQYKQIRQFQIDKIITLANSNIEPLELKGMLKLIAKTDCWKSEYETYIKKEEEKRGNL